MGCSIATNLVSYCYRLGFRPTLLPGASDTTPHTSSCRNQMSCSCRRRRRCRSYWGSRGRSLCWFRFLFRIDCRQTWMSFRSRYRWNPICGRLRSLWCGSRLCRRSSGIIRNPLHSQQPIALEQLLFKYTVNRRNKAAFFRRNKAVFFENRWPKIEITPIRPIFWPPK